MAANAPTRHQRQPWSGSANAVDQAEVEPATGSDACQVDHDHGTDAGIDCAFDHPMGRFAAEDSVACSRGARGGRDDRLAVSQVETEGDALTADGVTDLS